MPRGSTWSPGTRLSLGLFLVAWRRVHLRIRPYTPRTNGKAERFIQTLLREWAYRRPYATSTARRSALHGWLHHYNWHRDHGSLQGCPPMSRLLAADNLMRLHS